MIPNYARPLKVSSPDGKRIYAKVFRLESNVRIEINYLEVVKKDDPPFAHNGVITINVPREKYSKTIEILTRYIENLFLKGMADEDIYPSLGAKPKPRRTEKVDLGGKVSFAKRQGDSPSVHLSPRGSKSSESSRGGNADSEVAESSDSEDSGKD